MFACRLMVGESCLGKKDSPVPDIRCTANKTLYDTTVRQQGVKNPDMFVTYHDAQAYPEYLLTLKEI